MQYMMLGRAGQESNQKHIIYDKYAINIYDKYLDAFP